MISKAASAARPPKYSACRGGGINDWTVRAANSISCRFGTRGKLISGRWKVAVTNGRSTVIVRGLRRSVGPLGFALSGAAPEASLSALFVPTALLVVVMESFRMALH
jgi:hypothetical protein